MRLENKWCYRQINEIQGDNFICYRTVSWSHPSKGYHNPTSDTEYTKKSFEENIFVALV